MQFILAFDRYFSPPGRAPGSRPSGESEPLGYSAVAERAVELRSDPSRPLGLIQDPWALLKGRAMADVLVVKARQLGDPVAVLVLMEPDDGPLHALSRERA